MPENDPTLRQRVCPNCAAPIVMRQGEIQRNFRKRRACNKRCASMDREARIKARRAAALGVPVEDYDAAYFGSFVDRSAGEAACWPWMGTLSHDGYGLFCVKRKWRKASRVALKFSGANVPDDMCVCHTCDNRRCCNPAHMFLGTNADNTADKVAKGRQSRGGAVSKLTADQVRIMRTDAASGLTHAALSRQYGISRPSVSAIVRRKTWKHA